MAALIKFAIDQLAGLLVGAAVAVALLLLYNMIIENPQIRSQEREIVNAESRAKAMALIQQRSHDNAEITNLDAAHLCAELGGQWVLPDGRCD